MSSRWDLVIMYACIPCAGRCHCRASTGSWVPVFSVRKLGQFLRALSGLLQCVAVYWLWSSWLLTTSWLQSSDSELTLVDCEGSTSRPRDDRRTSRALVLESWAAWSSTTRASLGGWATLGPVTLSALTLLLRAPRSTRHADIRATHRGAFRLMTVAHLQEMFNRLHQLQSWFADYSRWDVYNPFWKTHSPYAQQDEQLGQKHSEHFSSRAIQDFVTFFSVLWEQPLWTVEIISFLKRHFTCDFQRRI